MFAKLGSSPAGAAIVDAPAGAGDHIHFGSKESDQTASNRDGFTS